MVKKLSPELKEKIAKAVVEAEQRTSADIALAVLPASDPYQSHLICYGFALGSIIDMGLWTAKTITGFPLLFAIQVTSVLAALFIPLLRGVYLKLVPKRVMHHYAARRACEEYLIVSRHAPAERPVVLLYISLTERYVHILHSRNVLQRVQNEAWETVIQEFTAGMKNDSLQDACLTAIQNIARILESSFPRNV